MNWYATILEWDGRTGNVFICNDENEMWSTRLSIINSESIRNRIADITKLPLNRIKFDSQYQKFYRRQTIFRYVVFPF